MRYTKVYRPPRRTALGRVLRVQYMEHAHTLTGALRPAGLCGSGTGNERLP